MIDRMLQRLGVKQPSGQRPEGDDTSNPANAAVVVHDSDAAVETLTPRPSEAIDITLIPPEDPAEPPDLPGIVWPLEPLLDRVVHEPNAVRYLHPDDLVKLEIEARMAVDRFDAKRALAVATVWSFHGRVPDTCDDLLRLALLPRGKWSKKSPVARASEVEQRIGPARMERLEG